MRNPFRKDSEPRCAYCAHGSAVNEREVACSRRGVVDGNDHCRHFRYDPLRRVPRRRPQLPTFSPDDFKL